LTIDDHRIHLIERAAARLRQPAIPASAAEASVVAEIAQASPERAVPRLEPEQRPLDGSTRPAALDAAALMKAGLIDWDVQDSRIVEEFRIVQNNLLRYSFGEDGAALNRAGNLVMITSAFAGEGKSFVALNLAVGIARQTERRVLLIDTDPKTRSLGQTFSLSTAPGLLDLTREGRPEIEGLIVPTIWENLEFLPLGNRGNGADAPSRTRIAGLIADIGRRYDERLIILDTASCLSSSDPHTLAPVMGQTVLVVAAGLTQQSDVEAALDLVRTCPVVSLLLNKIRSWSGHSFGSYGHPAI
jgi:protein-tyrosine kinase